MHPQKHQAEVVPDEFLGLVSHTNWCATGAGPGALLDLGWPQAINIYPSMLNDFCCSRLIRFNIISIFRYIMIIMRYLYISMIQIYQYYIVLHYDIYIYLVVDQYYFGSFFSPIGSIIIHQSIAEEHNVGTDRFLHSCVRPRWDDPKAELELRKGVLEAIQQLFIVY